MFVLKVLILVILPYGTAILFGAASERWCGKNLSALLSMAGLALGIYFVHKSFELLL